MDLTSLLIPVGIYGGILGYPILQFLAIKRMRGGWRVLALLPLLIMIPVLVVTFLGLSRGSNLWPIILIFVAPIVFAYLIILFFAHAAVQRKRHEKT
jgi:O-antigen ligase